MNVKQKGVVSDAMKDIADKINTDEIQKEFKETVVKSVIRTIKQFIVKQLKKIIKRLEDGTRK